MGRKKKACLSLLRLEVTSTAAARARHRLYIILTADDWPSQCLMDKSNMVTQDKNLAIRRDCVKKRKAEEKKEDSPKQTREKKKRKAACKKRCSSSKSGRKKIVSMHDLHGKQEERRRWAKKKPKFFWRSDCQKTKTRKEEPCSETKILFSAEQTSEAAASREKRDKTCSSHQLLSSSDGWAQTRRAKSGWTYQQKLL